VSNSEPGIAKSPAFAVPAPALVLGGVVSLEGGAVLAALLIPTAGIAGTVALRLCFGALGLLALRRPRWRRCLDIRILGLAVAVGALLVLHHLCFYEAIHRLPLGVAVTLEFAGPLAVALAGARHWTAVGWAILAAAGVAAAADIVAPGAIGVAGVFSGLAAGACWAGYIAVFPVLASRAGDRESLPLATLCAAVGVAPFGIVVNHAGMFTGRSLLLGAAVALLCDVLAYTLQADALRRMPRSLFSILTSTEPAAGAILGLLALGQRITLLQWAGIVAVVIASIGATRAHRAQEAQRSV
jgi:inner membrane transporter RhtA